MAASLQNRFTIAELVLHREGRPQPGEQSGMPSWESVGGLQHVVEQLKEMVLLPLLYPELFSHMRISPPRHATISACQISITSLVQGMPTRAVKMLQGCNRV